MNHKDVEWRRDLEYCRCSLHLKQYDIYVTLCFLTWWPTCHLTFNWMVGKIETVHSVTLLGGGRSTAK